MAQRNEGIEAKLSEMSESMLSHFDAIYGKLSDLKQEQTFMNAALRRIERDVSELKERAGRIEGKLDAHMRLPAHAGV